MKKLGTVLTVLLSLCMSVCVWADAGKAQNVDYKTDYYMIVESPDGGVDLYSEASADSTKLNDELIPNGTAIHVEGESKDDDGNVWLYTQLHGMYGFLQENYLKPATLSEAVASELKLFGSEEVNYSIKVDAREDGSVSLYKGPGEKYGTVSGGCGIANGENLYIDTEVDTGKDGRWGHTSAGDVTGWVNIGKATNTEETAVELIPENGGSAADLNLTPVPGQESTGEPAAEDSVEGKNSALDGEDTSSQDTAEVGKADGNGKITPSPANTATPTPKPTSTPTPKPTSTPTPEPTSTSTPTPEPTNTVTPTPEPTNTVTPTPEPTNTVTPTPEPTNTVTPTPEPTDTPVPTEVTTVTAAPESAEVSSEDAQSSSWVKNPVIWILIVVILIGIGVVIWLLKKNKNHKNDK